MNILCIETYRTINGYDKFGGEGNPKGIERGILKHSKSGAKISNVRVVDDIGTYNLKSFDAVVVSVGGNDASSKTEIELFEEKYDQFRQQHIRHGDYSVASSEMALPTRLDNLFSPYLTN